MNTAFTSRTMRPSHDDPTGSRLQRSRLAAFTTLIAACVAASTTAEGATEMCSPSSSGGRCFQVETAPDTWWKANKACISKGGTLASINTQNDKNAVEMFGRSHNNIPVWTGGQVEDYAWRWNGLRSRSLNYQGCYKDTADDPDLDVILETSTSLTPSRCAEICLAAQQKHVFSSVQFNTNNQIECRCGKTFNKYGPQRDSRCERPCPLPTQSTSTYDWRERENLERFCGNPEAQIVTRIWGLLFHYWVHPQDQGEDECAALDYSHMFQWKDFHCNDARLSHICEYGIPDTSSANCIFPKIWIVSKGVCFSKHTDDKNWYEAFEDCRQRGGYLLEIRDHLVQQELNENLMGSEERYWIALKRRIWQWRDGTKVETFVDWQDGQPKVTDKNNYRCILMKPSFYKWSSEDCNLRHPFVCEYDNGLGQTVPAPSTSTVPVQTSAPVPSATPTPNQQNTTTNGQQGQQLLNPAIIGAAAGGGGLFLIIVICIIAYCYHHEKGTKQKETMKKTRRPMDKSRTRSSPSAPTRSGYDNRAYTPREKGRHNRKGRTHKNLEQAPKGRDVKADRYASKLPTWKPDDTNHHRSSRPPQPERANIYEELTDDQKYTQDGYLHLKTPRGPDYDNIKQNRVPYDNYPHYMKPRH